VELSFEADGGAGRKAQRSRFERLSEIENESFVLL